MIDKLKYQDFIGSVHYSDKDQIFFGKLEGANDLVTFEGFSVKELNKAFIEAVKDYQHLYEVTGKNILRSFKGTFNVRISPECTGKHIGKHLRKAKR